MLNNIISGYSSNNNNNIGNRQCRRAERRGKYRDFIFIFTNNISNSIFIEFLVKYSLK